MQVKKAVILCGGMATRMLPLTKVTPKELLPLGAKPILHHLLEDCKKAGIEEVVLIISPSKQSIVNYFSKDKVLEKNLANHNKTTELKMLQDITNILPITYVVQTNPNGTLGALLYARKQLKNQPFLLLFGDEYLIAKESVMTQLLRTYEQHPTNLIALQEVDKSEVYKYGIITPGKKQGSNLQVCDFVEKPKVEEAPSNISYIGPAILKEDFFTYVDNMHIDSGNRYIEYGIADVFKLMIQKQELDGVMIEGTRCDIGSKLGLVQSNILITLQDETQSEQLLAFMRTLCNQQTLKTTTSKTSKTTTSTKSKTTKPSATKSKSKTTKK